MPSMSTRGGSRPSRSFLLDLCDGARAATRRASHRAARECEDRRSSDGERIAQLASESGRIDRRISVELRLDRLIELGEPVRLDQPAVKHVLYIPEVVREPAL